MFTSATVVSFIVVTMVVTAIVFVIVQILMTPSENATEPSENQSTIE